MTGHERSLLPGDLPGVVKPWRRREIRPKLSHPTGRKAAHITVQVSTFPMTTEFIKRARMLLPDCLGCTAIFVILLGCLGYIAYLPRTADHSDCSEYPATVEAMDQSRANILTLADRPEASRCDAYQSHVAALAKARSASLRCRGMLLRQAYVGNARQDSSPEMLLFEENFYQRLIADKCGAAR
ncbi:hypothetical protein HUN39_05155 [Methylocystis sp. FS]|uniref:hypothetical protein n=1 Tax=Methylocystis silviterrae TaxID=2743612 RepID=UPI001582926E|nr:hypothetical protein [Methylocystis silviterrae]NUJ79416.1 hypothetical protein [Methylocystis silviterrae]